MTSLSSGAKPQSEQMLYICKLDSWQKSNGIWIKSQRLSINKIIIQYVIYKLGDIWSGVHVLNQVPDLSIHYRYLEIGIQ